MKLHGVVKFYDKGLDSHFIQDDTGGLYCKTLQRVALQPGDQVEVLGFMAKGEYTPIPEAAAYRKVGPETEVTPDKA